MKNKLYTDSSFDWKSTNQTKENVVRGKIAISDGKDYNVVEKVAIGKVPKLKQYNNILELFAIGRAIEIAIEKDFEGILSLWSDSRVALAWAHNGKINPKVFTLAHKEALEYVLLMEEEYKGEVQFNHVKRDRNYAGHLLEKELKRERPHAV